MIALVHARLRLLRGDRGVALVTVIGIGAVLMLLATTMVAIAVSGAVKSSRDEDIAAAMSAAYAGVEDYKSKLANNNAYALYGSKASTFSTKSTFPRGTDGNPAFGTGTTGSAATWAKVDGDARAHYRYEVDNADYYTTGVLHVRSTGRVGDVTRSVVADLKQDGFIDYLYFTDYEIGDPEFGLTDAEQKCVPTRDWQTPHASNCTEIQFGSADVFDGPVRSNDTMVMCGSKFLSRVQTAYTPTRAGARNYKIATNPSSCTAPRQGTVESVGMIPMPATNEEMKQETRSDLASSTVPRPGCLYTGPTTVKLQSNGTMKVRSPWTLATLWTSNDGRTATGGGVSATCGTPGTAVELGHKDGATVAVPQNNVVYVQSVPRTSRDASTTPDPNDWRSGTYPAFDSARSTQYCSGATSTSTRVSTTGNGVGYPRIGETAPSTSSTSPSYGCEKGDVFVEGTLSGNLTIAADNYVYVTGDIVYDDAENDVLGLVGNQAVIIYNPVTTCSYDSRRGWSGSYLYPGATASRTVQAAILSVGHTFTVQNYTCGARGTLNVLGSIAQKYRGPVALTNGSGYDKSYGYDRRLQYTAPPKFLSPVATSYGVSRVTETRAAFDAAGRELR